MLGELALKDADKLMNLQSSSVKSYIIKACALMLRSSPIQSSRIGEVLPTSMSKSHGKAARSDDFDCTVCLKLLYEPATTPCGHPFCRLCLFQSMDRGNKCPLCRTVHLHYKFIKGSPVDIACEVDITECDPLPDGRFVLELESHRRCCIVKAWDQDAYRVAEVEWVTDIPPQSNQEKADLRELTTSAASFARSWLESKGSS